MSSFWNERYSAKEYVYGEEPNLFFAEQLGKLTPGHIILPCDGEGRNAVYAATQGWTVDAFDQSTEGQKKALALAANKGAAINYIIADASEDLYAPGSADAVAMIFAHLPPAIRKKLLHNIVSWLKPGGKLILEAYNPLQLRNDSGGPKDVNMLYTEDILNEDLGALKTEMLQSLEIDIREGTFHGGISDVIRYVGVK